MPRDDQQIDHDRNRIAKRDGNMLGFTKWGYIVGADKQALPNQTCTNPRNDATTNATRESPLSEILAFAPSTPT